MRRIADALYWLIFPGERVHRWSYALWNRLPQRVAAFLLRIA